MKKVLSLALVMILLFSALPMTAYAVEAEELAETGNQISTVSVTVTKPHSGENPVYSATVPSGEGYMVKNYNKSIDGYKNGVQWYSFDDEKYLDESDCFEVGKEYLVTVLLLPTEEGDTFDNNVTGTMNNGNAILRFNTNKSIIYVSRFFTCTEEIIIDYVNVNGVTGPQPGAHPVYSATVPSGEGYMVKDFSDAVNKNGISWENATDHKYMSESDTFEEGKNYTIQICLEPISDSFVFSSRAVGTVNGETAAIDRNLNSFITLLYTFTCNDPFIRNVSVSGITEPVAGAYPDGKYTLPANCGYTLENNYYGKVKWYTEDGDILDPQADKFQAGERYNAQVTVLASDGYAFADTGLKGTMNGKDVTSSIFTVNATKFYMSRWFTCPDPVIKKVSVTGVNKPVAGNSPSYSAVVSASNGYQISNTNNIVTKNGIGWFNMTDSTFLFPANNDQFEEGKEYGVFISLETTSSDYQFSDEPSATVNGKPATISAKGKNSITVFYIFSDSGDTGATVSGSITSYLSDTDQITVKLLDGDSVKYSASANGKSTSYSIENVANGTYTLRVSKLNHVDRDYTVTVSGDTTQNVKICPLGDTDLNGKLASKDAMLAYQHALKKEGAALTGYAFDCADADRNGKVVSKDAMLIYQQVMGKHTLF